MLQAEHTANQLNIPLTILGVKHPLDSLNLLLKRDTQTIYLSHKITEARADLRDRRNRLKSRRSGDPVEKWNDFVGYLNSIAGEVCNRGHVLIMPTAIDEFRLGQPSRGEPFNRPSTLEPRWPLPTQARLLYQPPEAGHEYTDLFRDAGSYNDKFAASLRGFENVISAEFPFRDHVLVYSTDHIFFFRPWAFSPRWSGGVRGELLHWSLLSKSINSRKAIFVHYIEDILGFINDFAPDGIWKDTEKYNLEQYARAILIEDGGYNQSDANTLMKTGKVQGGSLDAVGTNQKNAIRDLEDAISGAFTKLFYYHLTNSLDPTNQARIFIIDTPELKQANYTEIFDFLGRSVINEPVIDETFMEKIKPLIGTDLIALGRSIICEPVRAQPSASTQQASPSP
jgi:hypothetical protein